MEGIQYGIQQGFNPMTSGAYGAQPYGSQFGQQGLFGGAGGPLGGLIGSGIGGLLNAQNIGRQPGQAIDGMGGMFQAYGNPYGNVDPMTAAQLQQAQLVQQAQQAQLAQLVQQTQLAQQLAQQPLNRWSGFGADPISAASVQQRVFGQPQVHGAPWPGINPVNRIDPLTAAYIQQAQIAQLCQQLALQSQLGQQFGHGQIGQGQFGQGQPGQGWLGGGQNLWGNPQLAAGFGRSVPFQGVPVQYGGYGSQLPIY